MVSYVQLFQWQDGLLALKVFLICLGYHFLHTFCLRFVDKNYDPIDEYALPLPSPFFTIAKKELVCKSKWITFYDLNESNSIKYMYIYKLGFPPVRLQNSNWTHVVEESESAVLRRT